MHGPGYAPPREGPPSSAAVVLLRAMFMALALLSCGLLAWAAMLRLAVLRRRPLDWALFVATIVLTAALVFTIATWGSDTDAKEGNNVDGFVAIGLIATGVAVAVHFLVADLRRIDLMRLEWERTQGRPQGYAAPPAAHPATHPAGGFGPPPGPVPPGYGYPPPAATVPGPGYGYPAVNTPPPPAPGPPPAPAQPQPQAGAPAPRIDQVRAELDELSDYLRKGSRDNGDNGGHGR
ncbi:hypothetical protein [Streptomyces sp. NPDC058953]|uniref:hypothetical protein n=1 Tax=unclassified Streptomyces TaxID=2593676 RepID=UPI0036B48926